MPTTMHDLNHALTDLINTVVQGLGYELWGFEYRVHENSALLRIFIEHEKGILLENCAEVSHQLGAALEVDDLIPVAYVLEVSSPGVDRVLFIPEHYESYIGQDLKVRTQIAVEGRRNFKGKLSAVNTDYFTLEIDKNTYDIPFDTVDRARVTAKLFPKSSGGESGKRRKGR